MPSWVPNNNDLLELTIFFGSFIATYFGVRWFRSWSVNRGLIDHPNERSSHSIPTPRGGGLIIAAVVITAYILSSVLLSTELSWGFVAGSVLIVAVSWLDDRYSVSFSWRLLAHLIAAGFLIYSEGFVTSLNIPGIAVTINLGYIGAVLTFCWIVWLVNAYNFMDGIDGIAGIQAVSAALGWLLLGLSANASEIQLLAGTILFASLAFLLHNWPPARIFMGDSGSAFLGFVFAGLPLLVRTDGGIDRGFIAVIGIVLVWPFVFDSVFTLTRRLLRRERVWQAHREHLYQRLVVSGYSHRKTTMLYGAASFLNVSAVVFFLSRPGTFAVWIMAAVIFAESICLLALCRKRKCLWGQVS